MIQSLDWLPAPVVHPSAVASSQELVTVNPSEPLQPIASSWGDRVDSDRAWWLHDPHTRPVRLGFSEAYGIVQRVHLHPHSRTQDEYLYLADIETGERGLVPRYPPNTLFSVTTLEGQRYGVSFHTFVAADVVAYAAHTACLPALVQRFGAYSPLTPVSPEPVTIRWCWARAFSPTR